MRQDVKYYLVESGPVFELCQRWVRSYIDARKAAMDFAKKHGSDLCYTDSRTGTFAGAQFPWDKLPSGWTKPKGRQNLSWPKRRTAVYEEQKALPKAFNFLGALQEVVGEVPGKIAYSGGRVERGGVNVGAFFGVGCYTFAGDNGPFLIDMPDAALTWKFLKADNPEYVCTNGADAWSFEFEGCKPILKEEWDLMSKRHDVAQADAALKESAQ